MTSSQHGLYAQGDTRTTMPATKGRKPARGSKSHKSRLSSDWGLQPDPMKAESVVIADQHAAVNTFSGLVHTACHTTKAGYTRSHLVNSQETRVPKVWLVIGVKS